MSQVPAFQEVVSALGQHSPRGLLAASRGARQDLASAEWRLAACLLVAERTGAFQQLDFRDLVDMGERGLKLSARKIQGLLSVARALEHLPLLSEAFRDGTLCWAKLRAIQGVATPETESQWLEFCRHNPTSLVNQKVSLCPLSWKRGKALRASLAREPIVAPEDLARILQAPPTSEVILLPGASIITHKVFQSKRAAVEQEARARVKAIVASLHTEEPSQQTAALEAPAPATNRPLATKFDISATKIPIAIGSPNSSVVGNAAANFHFGSPGIHRADPAIDAPAEPTNKMKSLTLYLPTQHHHLLVKVETRLRGYIKTFIPRPVVLALMIESFLAELEVLSPSPGRPVIKSPLGRLAALRSA